MKKSVYLITFLFLSCPLFACNSNVPKDQEEVITFSGNIEEISAENIAIIKVEEGGILSSSDKVFVNLAVNQTETFQVGDKIEVGYTGIVMESYPAQIKTLSVEKVE